MSLFRPALVLLVLFSALTGIIYPLAVTGIAGAVWPSRATGSLVVSPSGSVTGSSLVGQAFTSDAYLWPRPSATSGPDPQDPSRSVAAPYNASNSSGSNLGPTSKALADRLAADVARLREKGIAGPVPGDAVTASASGLDPHVSPDFALAQAARIAAARGAAEPDVRGLIAGHVEGRELGIFGEPRVNVLAVNLALDARFPRS
jgi:K+-transporting ATPase ATPase C chain